jgi:L,D-transpeptidase ErfK/SrfK
MEIITKALHSARCRHPAAAALIALLALAVVLPARATVYTIAKPDDSIVGEDQTVVTVYEDTLYDLARKFSLGSEELIRVNPGVDPWIPGAGKTLVVPGRHILPPGPREGNCRQPARTPPVLLPEAEARRHA